MEVTTIYNASDESNTSNYGSSFTRTSSTRCDSCGGRCRPTLTKYELPEYKCSECGRLKSAVISLYKAAEMFPLVELYIEIYSCNYSKALKRLLIEEKTCGGVLGD